MKQYIIKVEVKDTDPLTESHAGHIVLNKDHRVILCSDPDLKERIRVVTNFLKIFLEEEAGI